MNDEDEFFSVSSIKVKNNFEAGAHTYLTFTYKELFNKEKISDFLLHN